MADAAADADVVEAGPVAPAAVAPARCRPTPGGAAIAGADLELGGEVLFGDGYALGLVHRTAAGRVMAVALVDKAVSTARVVDLGVTPGDAPPPRVTRQGDDVLVAGYAVPDGGDARQLAVFRVTAGGEARPFASLAQQRDDSMAFDLGANLVAWDETAKGTPPRGVIRVVKLAVEGGGAAHDVSSPDSDAEMPRVVAGGAGSFVLWLARRPEPLGALDAAEATGEARVYSWLEEVNIDAAGAPLGPARHLTPAAGHVSAYDVEALAGEGRPSLLVIARDDGEAVDGSGGALLRVRVREDGADPPLVLPGDGLGRGAPWLIDAPWPWAAWVGPHEELRLLPLDAAGAPVGLPSGEPLLDEALPMAMQAGPTEPTGPTGHTGQTGQSADLRMLAAFPNGDPSAALRLFACSR
jgi:hypothetical protein